MANIKGRKMPGLQARKRQRGWIHACVKQRVYLHEWVKEEMVKQAKRLNVSLNEIVRMSWRMAKDEITMIPTEEIEDLD